VTPIIHTFSQQIDNEQVTDLDEAIQGILQEWQEKYKYDTLHSVAYF